MKRLLVFILMIAGLNLNAQILVRKGEANIEPRLSRFSFCISLLPGTNSNPVSYGIHQLCPDGSEKVSFMQFDSFLRQFGGAEESRANPERIDFMETKNISQETIRDLWKLRYASYPVGKSKELGWGMECGAPSDAQMEILKQYGLKFVGGVVYGDSLFSLLKDVGDPAWVERYKSAK